MRRTLLRLGVALVGLLLVATPIYAVHKKVGTSGAQFMKIGAGPRPTAMGNAFTGLADDVNAVYYNPAGLSYLQRPEILAMHAQWFQDMNYDFGAFAYPTDHGAFALSAMTLKVNEVQRRGTDETAQGSFDAQDASYALSYSRYFGPLLSIGVTGRYIEEKIDTYKANAWAGDVGIIKRAKEWPVSFGLAVKNMGSPIQFKDKSDPLPLTVNGGVAMNLFDEKVKLTADANKPRDNQLQFCGGLELNSYFGKDLKLSARGGYDMATTSADGSGLTLGGGVTIRNLNFDAAWIPYGDLGNTFRYAIHVKF